MSKTARILIVDDEPAIRELFSEFLRLEGHEVWEAATGREGLELARRWQPDLVLLDVMLPDANGMEICRQLKAESGLADVFVLLFSGEATSGTHKMQGAATGADDYIVKPVGREEFLARIRTMLRLRETTVALRTSEQHYRRLVEILPDGVFRLSPAGRLLAVNPQGAVLLGYESPEELAGKSLLDLTPAEDQDRIRNDLAIASASGSIRNREYRLHRKQADLLPVELSANVLRNAPDQPLELVGILRDLTERKRFEEGLRQLPRRIIEAQEAERLRVSRELHDGVNQLLASARMRLRRVEESVPEFRPAAREILVRCHDLLVQALEENRRIAYNLRPGELNELGLAVSCHNLCQQFQDRTQIAVHCTIPSQLEQHLSPSVELNLFRIAQEALSNVERHAQAKQVRLTFTVEGTGLVLKIQDDGCGFDPKLTQAQKDNRHGIGLSSIRERAAVLGGICEIDSVPSQGTTITVRVSQKHQPSTLGYGEGTPLLA